MIARGPALGLLLAGLGCAAACSSSATSDAPSFGGAPLETVTSETGALRVDIFASPSSPTRGTGAFELRVTDAKTGAPRDGLALTMVPWMPFHGHGTSQKPTVMAAGDGRYVATNVNLYMPGRWELRTTLEGEVSDRAAPPIDVP